MGGILETKVGKRVKLKWALLEERQKPLLKEAEQLISKIKSLDPEWTDPNGR